MQTGREQYTAGVNGLNEMRPRRTFSNQKCFTNVCVRARMFYSSKVQCTLCVLPNLKNLLLAIEMCCDSAGFTFGSCPKSVSVQIRTSNPP